VDLTITGGVIQISSLDDAIHSNDSITINGGDLTLASGDDGIHADAALTINGGDLEITECYEGLESAVITINDGTIQLTASDDGINASSRSRGGFESADGYVYINGGYLAMDAGGDGLDSNGSIEMTGGVVIVNGPTSNGNGALDSGSFSISGGFLVAAGSSGMAQSPDESSNQYSVLLNFGATIRAGTLIHIQSSEGEEVLTFAPAKQYETIVLSSPALKSTTYDVYLGGNATGSARDGLYEGGINSSGTDIGNFTISGIVTWVGGRNRR
jgi:hypothetical protein